MIFDSLCNQPKNFPSQLQLIDELGCKMKKLQKHKVYWIKKSILKRFPRLDNCCCITEQEKKAKMGLITRPHAFTQAKFFSQYSQLWSAESSSIPSSFTTTKIQSNWQSQTTTTAAALHAWSSQITQESNSKPNSFFSPPTTNQPTWNTKSQHPLQQLEILIKKRLLPRRLQLDKKAFKIYTKIIL